MPSGERIGALRDPGGDHGHAAGWASSIWRVGPTRHFEREGRDQAVSSRVRRRCVRQPASGRSAKIPSRSARSSEHRGEASRRRRHARRAAMPRHGIRRGRHRCAGSCTGTADSRRGSSRDLPRGLRGGAVRAPASDRSSRRETGQHPRHRRGERRSSLLDFGGIAKLIAPGLGGAAVDQTGTLFRLLTPDYARPRAGCAVRSVHDRERRFMRSASCSMKLLKPGGGLTAPGRSPRRRTWFGSFAMRSRRSRNRRRQVVHSGRRRGGPEETRSSERRIDQEISDTIVLRPFARSLPPVCVGQRDGPWISGGTSGPPCVARRDSVGYRAGKEFARRHRAGVAGPLRRSDFAHGRGLFGTFARRGRARAAEARAGGGLPRSAR